MGVYYLMNVGEHSQKLDVYVNDSRYSKSYPGKLTPIFHVDPGDKITLVRRGFFKKEVFDEFLLTKDDFNTDISNDKCLKEMQAMAMNQVFRPIGAFGPLYRKLILLVLSFIK